MNLKNYTSNVPVEKTVSRIEQVIASAGASGIMKDYDQGTLQAISFKVLLPNGKPVTIRLPANHEAVYQTMSKEVKRPHKGTLDRIKEQSARTAWKLMQDWVEVQISLISMHQVDFMQVFLPYVWDGEQTFYHKLKGKNFLALAEKN